MIEILHSQPAQIIWQAILASLWQTTLLAAILAILLRLIHSPNLRYTLACIAMLLSIALPVLSALPHSAPATPAMLTQLPLPNASPHALPASSNTLVAASPWQLLRPIALCTWAFGVVALSLWQIGGWFYLLRLRRRGKTISYEPLLSLASKLHVRSPRLIESLHVHAPAVAGLFKPVILLPLGILTNLPTQQIEAILAHELAHIRRCDYLANLLQSLIETLMFYHPCIWWISKTIHIEREVCCDEIATTISGDRSEYAQALLTLETHRSPHLALGAGTQLTHRIRRLLIMQNHQPRRTISAIASLTTILCLIVPMVLASRAHADASAPATGSDFPHVVNFKTYDETFQAGDKIEITEIRGTSDAIARGNIYLVKGKYTLASQDSATIAAFTTAANSNEGKGSYMPVQTKVVSKGSGTFSISLPMTIDGQAHISFYPAKGGGSFGGIYFKTAAASAATQPSAPAFHISTPTHPRTEDYPLKPGLHLRKALRDADADKDIGVIWINTDAGTPGSYHGRTSVSGLAFARGEASADIAVEPGDWIDVVPRGMKQIRLIITNNGPTLYGKDITWDKFTEILLAKSEDERWNTRLEIAANAASISADQMNAAMTRANDLVKQYGLVQAINVGVFPNATRRLTGVYYLNGAVLRGGIYELSVARPINMKQAIIAAGLRKQKPLYLVVLRSDAGKQWTLVDNCKLKDDFSNPELQIGIEADDMIMLLDHPATRATQPAN